MKQLLTIMAIGIILLGAVLPAHAQNDGNKNEQRALKKAKKIYQKLQIGGDFGKLARKHSDDIGSKDYEGRLGFMEKGQLVPEYEKAALNLKVGEISKPVRTDFGFHIIQLLAVKGERFDTRHILIRP